MLKNIFLSFIPQSIIYCNYKLINVSLYNVTYKGHNIFIHKIKYRGKNSIYNV